MKKNKILQERISKVKSSVKEFVDSCFKRIDLEYYADKFANAISIIDEKSDVYSIAHKSFFEGYYFMSKHIWHNLDDIPIVGKLILVEDDTEEKYTLYRVGSIDDYKQLAYHFNIKRWLYVEELC